MSNSALMLACVFSCLLPAIAWGADVDGDGYDESVDCDDNNSDVYPGSSAAEVCDGVSSDCGLVVGAEESDQDGDGWVACSPWQGSGPIQGGGDCSAFNPNVYPGATEICDGLDSNCDGATPGDEADWDGDGWLSCSPLQSPSPAAGGDDRGYPGAPDHFRAVVAQHRRRRPAEAFSRRTTLPGEEAQVDWGHFGKLDVPGGQRPVYASVMVLAYSR